MRKLTLLSGLVLLFACGEPPTSPSLLPPPVQPSFGLFTSAEAPAYVLFLKKNVGRVDLQRAVEAGGGALEAFYPFGIAMARSGSPSFAASVARVASAVPDVGFQVHLPAAMEALPEGYGLPPSSGDDDFFFDLQWGHTYVGATQAWDAGFQGQGVRVAVLDGGFDLDNPDLAPNLNLGLSKDFTGEGLQYNLPNTFSHGSHIAGIIAAADNGYGIIGVAPKAELIAVKVLGDEGTGSFGDIIAGIYYATVNDADIINLSLGAYFPRTGEYTPSYTALVVAVSHAVKYARQQGSLVVTSAGNDSEDLDGDGDYIRFMTGVPGATGISALTTLDWAGDPANAPLVPASYTNYGTSMVDFSAPGGSVDYPGNEGCVVAGLARPCWVFDMVFSTGNGGWYWSAGTSMAAAYASGVAALIISENGGEMHPAQVERALQRAAVRMAEGRTDFFGFGLVNSGY